MCGICGIISLDSNSVTENELLLMRESLLHRGPDDSGVYLNGGVGLAHRRLSIIDLSSYAKQPICNEDSTVWVVCNGEIYNHLTLRKELELCGHCFKSRSDTEVIVHAYEEWGDQCVEHFIGMFAFAVWDENNRSLLLARDRLGVKPLYYLLQEGRLLFASELQTLYQHIDLTYDDIDRSALDSYLAFGFVPPDTCLIKQVNKLKPAHKIIYDHNGIDIKKYWNIKIEPDSNRKLSSYIEELDEKLYVSVSRRLESDVPIGCFLSGGIDSGLITAMASNYSSNAIETFSVGFTSMQASDNEIPLAELVASKYKSNHHELIVNPDVGEVLPSLLWSCGEPFADSSIIPTYMMCNSAKQFITVALTGDGGDESFAGYKHIEVAYLASKIKNIIPEKILNNFKRFGNQRLPGMRRINTLLTYATSSVSKLYDNPNRFDVGSRNNLYHNNWLNDLQSFDSLEQISETIEHVRELEEAEQMLYNDFHWVLPGDYLTKMDVASSRAAVEIRSPFLDHELIEFANTIPINIKLLGLKQKGLLREFSKRYLPIELINQPKRGFRPPIDRWLREDLAPIARNLIHSLASRDVIFDGTILTRLVNEHISGRYNHAGKLWTLICLEIWLQLFIDKRIMPNHPLNTSI